jgi:hypothetical protein
MYRWQKLVTIINTETEIKLNVNLLILFQQIVSHNNSH